MTLYYYQKNWRTQSSWSKISRYVQECCVIMSLSASIFQLFFVDLGAIGDIVLRALPLKIQQELMEKGFIMLMPMQNIVLSLKRN
jgi:hypothetical protein